MGQFITLLAYLVGLPAAGFVVYIFLERIIRRLDARAERKSELDELNQIQECSSCGRVSRNYQRELARYNLLFKEEAWIKASPDTTSLPCPHCGAAAAFLPVSVNLSFRKTHPDCLPLDSEDYPEYRRQMEQYEELLYRAKVNESFKKQNRFLGK